MWGSTASLRSRKTTGNPGSSSHIATYGIKAKVAVQNQAVSLTCLLSPLTRSRGMMEPYFLPPDWTFSGIGFRQPQSVALGVRGHQGLEGYGVLRACRHGFKVGPLFADGPDVADTLYQGLASRVSGLPIFLDTPEANPAAIELAKRHGMEPVFETARMYTKGFPAGRIDRCFGVTTFELG